MRYETDGDTHFPSKPNKHTQELHNCHPCHRQGRRRLRMTRNTHFTHTNCPIVMEKSLANMLDITQQLKKIFPNARIYVAATCGVASDHPNITHTAHPWGNCSHHNMRTSSWPTGKKRHKPHAPSNRYSTLDS